MLCMPLRGSILIPTVIIFAMMVMAAPLGAIHWLAATRTRCPIGHRYPRYDDNEEKRSVLDQKSGVGTVPHPLPAGVSLICKISPV